MRETGVVYTCPPGQHDDLGISCAMLAWAARHPHLDSWVNTAFFSRRAAPAASKSQLGSLDMTEARQNNFHPRASPLLRGGSVRLCPDRVGKQRCGLSCSISLEPRLSKLNASCGTGSFLAFFLLAASGAAPLGLRRSRR